MIKWSLRSLEMIDFVKLFNAKKSYLNSNIEQINLMNDNDFLFRRVIINRSKMNSFDFYHLTKFEKTSKAQVSGNLTPDPNFHKQYKINPRDRISSTIYHSIIKKGLKDKKIRKEIVLKEKNLYNLFHSISNMKIIKILLIFTILYIIFFKVRLLRFTLSRIFYRISSEPKSIIYELYFGSKLNQYVKQIITEVIHDEEVQIKATNYIIELLEEESFIASIAKFTNHLLVKILSQEPLTDTFSNRLIFILRSEQLENEIKNFLDQTVKREEFRRNLMKLIAYYTFRKESKDAIKQLIEFGMWEIKYDYDLSPNLINLTIEILLSTFIRRRYFEHHNKHFLNDYPDEKSMQRVLDIIKEEDYIFAENYNKSSDSDKINEDYENNNYSAKKNMSFFDNLFIKKFSNNKQKYEILYKFNNYYIDGYLSKENPKKAREKIIELGKIFNNVIYTDVEFHPHLGTFSNFAPFLDEDYFKLIMDKQLLRNNVFLDIHKIDNVYLKKFIKDKQIHEEFSSKTSDTHLNDKRIKDLSDYRLKFDINFYDFLDKHKLGEYLYRETLYQMNDLENTKLLFKFPVIRKYHSIINSSPLQDNFKKKNSREYPFNKMNEFKHNSDSVDKKI